ncbi:MAG: hypothetical protein A4E19_15590 [Nitrospira sp. SG-bin1]|nr:MAG: hypothetical protein A4E19_15590 [Nitrospira sp. SG-bin1]
MIARLRSPVNASTHFSVDQLPETVQEAALWNLLIPIVKSESMTPTLQLGDALGLEQADHLRVGEVVVFRYDRLLVCHRIHRIDGHRLFLRGDANTGPFEEVDSRRIVGRVGFLLRHGQRIAVCPSRNPQRVRSDDSLWTHPFRWGGGLARRLALRWVNAVASFPGAERVVLHILQRLMIIEIMERVSLNTLEGYVLRQRVHSDRLARCLQDLSPLNRNNLVLVVRAGFAYLGTCTLDPWHIRMRPLLQRQTTRVLFDAVDPFSPLLIPSRSDLSSTTSRKQ